MRVAIIGAGGFVGSRILERWALAGTHEPVPVVRHAGSLARVARFNLPWKIADTRDEQALGPALLGCEALVQCMVGDGEAILGAVAPTYRAAAAAGVKRIVYLSSAMVHGHAPAPGTDERSEPVSGQGHDYNDARVSAELRLLDLRRGGGPEVVLLRPSVVYGPRSRWISEAAEQLLSGRAGWVGAGRGCWNGIYVDNLVHAVERALAAGLAADARAFLVRDAEPLAWRDLLLPVAASLGLGESAFAEMPLLVPGPRRDAPGVLDGVRRFLLRHKLNEAIPGRVKAAVKGAADGWTSRPSSGPSRLPEGARQPRLPDEWNLLQQCRWEMPIAAAREVLGYAPPVPAAEGVRRSLEWLAWAGYPVKPPVAS